MKSTNLPYLDNKGQKENSKNIYNNSIIQKNNIRCEKYFIGYNKNELSLLDKAQIHNNSIYGTGYLSFNNNFAVISNELLEEVCLYGKKIFSICKKTLKDQNILFSISITDAEFKKISNIFIEWCKTHGFPILPIKYSFLNNEINYYELNYEKISILTKQFLIIYLLHTFYIDLSFCLKNSNCSYNIDNTTLKRLNEFISLLGISNINLDDNFYELSEIDIIKLLKSTLPKIIPVFNEYSSYFNHPSKKYFSFIEGRIHYQQVYDNIVDVCWDLIASNYNHFAFSTKKCKICSKEFTSKTDKKYCDECTKKIHYAKNTHESKKKLIKDIINAYNNIYEYLPNNKLKLKKQVEHYASLISEKGHSKDIEKLSKKELEKFYSELQNTYYNYQ